MNFASRSPEKELLDQDDIPFADIKKNMQELNFINSKLGGHAITISGLKKLMGKKRRLTVCEIGCGGGDNLLAIQGWCQKRRIDADFVGIDIKPACIDFAKTRTALSTHTSWITSDYRDVKFERPPDIIFSSLFCHHFPFSDLVSQVRWMRDNSVLGFFINDLQRHWLAYRSIKMLTRLFSSSYLVKNDAPLSVARGFTKSDWQLIFNEAGLNNYDINWKWAFRYLITATR